MGTKVVKNVADATERVQVNVVMPSEGRKGAGFGKVVMFGTIPGILLGGAGVTAAAYATSDDFDDVVADMKDAAEDLLNLDKGDNGAEAEVVTEEVPAEEVVTEEVPAEEVPAMMDEADAVQLPDPLSIAEVDDDMSFGEAFAEARSQVGSGGVFEWHGNYYSTYTKEEWDNMDAEERGEYMEQYYNTDMDSAEDEIIDEPEEMTEEEIAASLVDREDVHVEHTQEVQVTVSEQSVYVDPETDEVVIAEQSVTVVDDETIDVHAVTGTIDGHDALYADVDEDGIVDLKFVDSDDDGVVDTDEIFDIQDADISMDEIGGGMGDDIC